MQVAPLLEIHPLSVSELVLPGKRVSLSCCISLSAFIDVTFGVTIADQRKVLPVTCPRVKNATKKWRNCKIMFSVLNLDSEGNLSSTHQLMLQSPLKFWHLERTKA